MSVLLVGAAIAALAFTGYVCGRLHAEFLDDQREPERPADWAQRLAHEDPQRLVNLFREGKVPRE
jgi:hypothetical protein